ncbi:hypothetical protein JCM10908_006393 [Rhodotorula pacifica]|uniref:uncharacterized protein n=1 Tax=Rhodotorula pacifica TaxID=1495444 RepID=UPI003174B804
MSTSPRLPLLAPPRPSFPARFDTSEHVSETGSSQASWPEQGENEDAKAVKSSACGEPEPVWKIKTDKELHLDRLEARLQQLRSDPPPDLPLEDDAFLLPGNELDDFEQPEETEEETHQPAEDEEGRALLSDVPSPGVQHLREQASPVKEPELEASSPSSGNVFDDSFGKAERPSRPTARVPSRISFKDSVRITSGFRTSSHNHAHPRPSNALAPLTERIGLLSSQNKTGSAPSDLLVQAVIPSAPSSRSASPLARGSHRMSQSAASLGGMANHLHVGSYPYSSSPTSYAASRSSSPCSSIYAPLQPPSRHCPNPMLVRPVGGQLRRKRSSSSFQEFLRKTRQLSSDDDDDEDGDGEGDESDDDADADAKLDLDDGGDGPEPSRLEYHDLVEQQRAKKARWEARRRVRAAQKRQEALRAAPTLWTKLGRLFLYGHSEEEQTAPAEEGRRARPTARTAHDRLARQSHEHSPVRSSPLARAASQSSLSTVSTMADSDGDSADGRASRSNGTPSSVRSSASIKRNPARPSAGRISKITSIKTEEDVRFGPAPARYFTAGWIKHQFRRLRRAISQVFKTALAGWHASQRKRERERPVGYGAV